MYEVYSDFDVTFKRNAKTGDVNKKRNFDDIRQSLELLLRTRYYERKWNPQIGSDFSKILFSQGDIVSLNIIKRDLERLLKNYEPRISVNSIDVYYKDEMAVSAGAVTVVIDYTVLNLGNDTFYFVMDRSR